MIYDEIITTQDIFEMNIAIKLSVKISALLLLHISE